MADIAALRRKAEELDIEPSNKDDAVVTNLVFEATVEDHLVQPSFVFDNPAAICPLARKHPEDPAIALRFEAFVAGMELGNAYTELNDPLVQRERFQEQMKERHGDDNEQWTIDEDYLLALEYGMPPTGGLGIGIDRLVMLFTNKQSIREVILFPQLREKS